MAVVAAITVVSSACSFFSDGRASRPDLEQVVAAILADPVAKSNETATNLGERIYSLIYERPQEPPKVATAITEDELRKALLSDKDAFAQEGWIYRIGRAPSRPEPSDTVRIYMNVVPDHVAEAVDKLTGDMNAAHLPFVLKVGSTLSTLQRSSAAVLYVERQDYRSVRPIVAATVREVPGAFTEPIVPLTKRITRGVSAADEPDTAFAPKTRPKHSFGTFIADVFAEALIESRRDGRSDLLLEYALKHFRTYGVDPARPYLRRGHLDDDL